jgi:hypothetical protein
MASLLRGTVIAVDVIPEVDLRAEGDLPMHLSGWEVAWRRLNPLAETIRMPNIASILLRSVTIASHGLRRGGQSAKLAALYLRPNVDHWNLLDFKSAGPIAEQGYRGTIEQIRAWRKSRRERMDPESQRIVSSRTSCSSPSRRSAIRTF